MSKKIKIVIIVFIGLIVAYLIYLGILLFERWTIPKFEENIVVISWESYKNDELGFELKYPDELIIIEEMEKGIELSNGFPLQYEDPCDMMGTGRQFDTFYNVSFTIQIFNKNLRDTFYALEQDEWLLENFLAGDNELKISPGFIEEISVGEMEGYKINSGAEGCGQHEYFFILPEKGKTIYINRPYLDENVLYFQRITSENEVIILNEEIKKHPEYLEKQTREDVFNQILSSLTIR